VSLVHPDGAIPYASVGWPGLVGVVTGVNAEGIAVLLHPAQTSDVRLTRAAQPTPLIARDVLENARTQAEAIAVIQQAEPLGAAAFVIVDGNARTWAVVERSPQRFAVRTAPSPPVVSDLLAATPFVDDPANDRARRLRPSAARAGRLAEILASRPPATPEDAAAALRDRRGPGGAPRPLGHRGAVDDLGAAHVALIDASSLVLWIADGGAAGRMRAVDLRHELHGEGTHPAPPPDVPPDAGLDADAAAAVVAARALVRAARAASGERARELAARALALAPTYPAVLRTAGDLARRAGDDAGARAYYQRWLELGSDDPAAEEEIRAYLAREEGPAPLCAHDS
jgi:hypothetical protein